VRIGVITALIVLCILYPFLPGEYDSLAVGLSTMAQVAGMSGLLLVPIGVLWLAYEWRRARRKQNLPVKTRGNVFALVSLIVASLVAIAVVFVAYATVGLAFGLLILVLWLYILSRLIPKLRLLKNSESERFNPAPLYFIFIPLAVLLVQLTLAVPAAEFSRNHAIAMSAELIGDIEAYHAAYGRYPNSLLAVYKDYSPGVVGIEGYHYAPEGDAYNLFFEQPRFLFDNFGTREFVVYNPLDEQRMTSHASWILILRPEQLETTQGWYAVHDASRPHWKYFWFD
jgi:hypothetical protein